MSDKTDATDAETLARIGRYPGSKRTDTFMVKAAVTRLINAGMVAQPNTTGRLYLTEKGTEAHWQPTRRPAERASQPERIVCDNTVRPLPSKVMQRMTPAEVKLKAPYAVTRTMAARGFPALDNTVTAAEAAAEGSDRATAVRDARRRAANTRRAARKRARISRRANR